MDNSIDPVLSIKDINKAFSGVKVLNDINLDIHNGEVFGILGENGAGKVDPFENIMWHLYPDKRIHIFKREQCYNFHTDRGKKTWYQHDSPRIQPDTDPLCL